MIYWLDKRGAEIVASLEGTSIQNFSWRKESRWFQAEHDPAVNNYCLDLQEACHSTQNVTLFVQILKVTICKYRHLNQS